GDLEDTTSVEWLNEHLRFRFGQIVRGRYLIRIEALEPDTSHLELDRSTGGENGPWKIANAEAGVRLNGGETATWTLDWDCTPGVDSVRCTLKRSGGSAKRAHKE